MNSAYEEQTDLTHGVAVPESALRKIGRIIMRKKSHISLAGYLVRELEIAELADHKKSFYFGSILPDLSPKMIKAPHQFEGTFDELCGLIREILTEEVSGYWSERVLWRRIGVVLHYLADYFTFPHNTSFEGSLKDHCLYERDMKYWMRVYVRTPEAKQIFRNQRKEARQIESAEELFAYIAGMHGSYMEGEHSVEDDCRWIIRLCSSVLIALAVMLDEGREFSPQFRYHYA